MVKKKYTKQNKMKQENAVLSLRPGKESFWSKGVTTDIEYSLEIN